MIVLHSNVTNIQSNMLSNNQVSYPPINFGTGFISFLFSFNIFFFSLLLLQLVRESQICDLTPDLVASSIREILMDPPPVPSKQCVEIHKYLLLLVAPHRVVVLNIMRRWGGI